MDAFLTGMVISIFVCVVLPVAIVWIVFAAIRNSDNKRAEILIKAIENNANVDADKIAEAFNKKPKTPRQLFIGRLLRGCIFTLIGVAFAVWIPLAHLADGEVRGAVIFSGISFAIGISYLIVSFLTRKSLKE